MKESELIEILTQHNPDFDQPITLYVGPVCGLDEWVDAGTAIAAFVTAATGIEHYYDEPAYVVRPR